MYSEAHAERAIRFIEKLRHTKGIWGGQNFKLAPWQKEVIRKIFGEVDEYGNRIIRTAYVEIARKNGKSELAAAIALALFFIDGEAGAEIYSAAADRDQAAIVFSVAKHMVIQEPALMRRCKIIDSTKRIVKNDGSFYRVLSSDSHTKHGFNAHGIIFDELHAQPNRDLWDVLTTSQGTRRQPLIFAITTAGYDRNSICYELHEYACKVRDGIIQDKTFLPVIYSVEESDDWKDEENWKKANPGLGDFRDIEEMRMMFKRAKETPALENTFRRLYLNQWTKQDIRFISIDKWDACDKPFAEDDLKKVPVYAGLDLASTTDIAALVLVGRNGDDVFTLPFFWIPEDGARERSRKDRVPYEVWIDHGFIIPTPGNVIDYGYIKHKILELAQVFDIREIAFDRWGAIQLSTELTDEGLVMVPTGQGMGSMSAPTKELLNMVLGKQICHNGNPVLRWMCDNMVVKQDANGNIKPDKGSSSEKIDGMVALIMAIDRLTRNGSDKSIYSEREMLTL